MLMLCTSYASDPAFNQAKQEYYLDKRIIERPENYFESALRKFRGFPHLDKAYRLIDESRYFESKIEFQRLFEIDPLDIKARLAYIIMLYKIKEYPEVIQQTNLVLKQPDNNVIFLLYRALAHNALGNKEQALKDLNSIIASSHVLDEDKLFALETSLIILLEQKAYQQSLFFFDQYPVKKKDFNYFMRYAMARKGLGEYDLAIDAYQAALALDRGNHEALRSLSYLYYDLGDLDKAIDIMNELLLQQYNDKDQKFLANLFYAKKNYSSAAKLYETLLLKQTQKSDLYSTYILLGHSYSNVNEYAMAVQAFQHAAEINQSSKEVMQYLANSLENNGNVDKAIEVYRKWLDKEKSAEIYIKLSNLYIRSGDKNSALRTLELALQSGASRDQRKIVFQTQGELLYQQKRYVQANNALREAAKIDPSDLELSAKIDSIDLVLLNRFAMISLENGHLEKASDALKKSLKIRKSANTLFMLAEIEKKLGNWGRSVNIYRHLIQFDELESKQKSNALTNLGLLYLDQGEEQLSLGYLRAAASMDEQSWVINQILGKAYARFDKWNEALVQFQSALSKKNNLENLLNSAQASSKLNKVEIANHYFQQAIQQAGKDDVSLEEKKIVLDTFGYFLVDQKEYNQAVEQWRQSLRIKDDAVIEMKLNMLLSSEFDDDQFLNKLELMDDNRLSNELNAERYDYIARHRAKKKQFLSAIIAQKKALSFIETAERHYMLGNYFQANQQNKESLEQFKLAADKDSSNTTFMSALGYAYSSNNQLNQSIQILEKAVEKDSKNINLHEQLAYFNLRKSDNKAGAFWFKQAIDLRTAQLGNNQTHVVSKNSELTNLKREVRDLEDNFNLTIYSGYRQNNNTLNVTGAAGTFGGVIPSQGGVELSYRPPIIGLRDGRIFTLFSRMLWSMEPGSFKVDPKTFQSTIGVRYKPFKAHNFYLSAEKLIKIGDSSQNNWLIRGMYGWTNGFDMNFGKQYWNYTTLFGDLGYFIQSPSILSFFGEARQGISFNVWDSLVLTPHAVIDGRIQKKDESNLSYLEFGGGLSLKYYFNQTVYSAPKSYIEFLFHYKTGIVNIDSGFNAMGILRY